MEPITAFLGAKAAFQGIKKFVYSKNITKLEAELARDFFEGFSPEERSIAEIKLKQIELEDAMIKNTSIKVQVGIEKEIIALMESRLRQQQEELQKKAATQLDIANTILSMQKSTNDMKDFILKKNRFNDEFVSTAKSELTNELNVKLNAQYKILQEITTNHQKTASSLKQEATRIDQSFKLIDSLSKNLDKQEQAIIFMDERFAKHKKTLRITYILTLFIVASGFWFFDKYSFADGFKIVPNASISATNEPPVAEKTPEQLIYSALNGYLHGMVDAINSGNISIIDSYVKKESPLYASQTKLVAKLYKKGTTEQLKNFQCDTAQIQKDPNANIWKVPVTETHKIIQADGSSKLLTNAYTYTIILDENNNYLLTAIAKGE